MISNISQLISTSLPSTSSPVSSSSAATDAVTNAIPGGAAQTSASTQAGSTLAAQHVSEAGKALAAAVDDLNVKIQRLNRNLEFSIDKDSGDLLVKVVDAQTHELIRQIPSEEAMALAHNIDKYLQEHHIGLLQTKA